MMPPRLRPLAPLPKPQTQRSAAIVPSRIAIRRVPGAAIVGALAIALLLAGRAWGESNPALAPTPAQPVALDATIQSAITTFGQAGDAASRRAALERLQVIDQSRRVDLVQQLVIHAAKAPTGRDALSAGAILTELNVIERDAVAAITPLLDSADAAVVRQAANILGGYEHASAERPPDYAAYREILASAVRDGAPLPAGLVEHMYAQAPGVALRTMMRAVQIRQPDRLKSLLWAEHAVADVLWKQEFGFLKPTEVEPEAVAQLARLAGDPAWWVRLYAAQIMLQHAAFRDPDLLAGFQEDDNRLVRQAAEAVRAER